jgi:hypothetical protein
MGVEHAGDAAAAEIKGIGMPTPALEKQIAMEKGEQYPITDTDSEAELHKPSEEELRSLRRVPARIPWIAFTVAFVELCERFAYYGTTAVSELHMTLGLVCYLN